MKQILYLCLMLAFGSALPLIAQEGPLAKSRLYDHGRVFDRQNPVTLNPNWAPFYHGVASGDPLADQVIIWTRVTPEAGSEDPIEVAWKIALDPQLSDIVQTGTFTTDSDRDFTVKVDVTGLDAGTTYYYGFEAMGATSLTGKTKTTPTADQAQHLKFGVVSCSNFQAGYFNAYGRLGDRTDLDAILHLGDYIYEYSDGYYGDSTLFDERPLEPANEIVTLEEYRARYSTYRLDTNLVRAHQQHPFITVWDDHESANDAYTDGAENHDPTTEGDWETRKAVSKQAYFEWMPIRDNANQQVYRTISYGDIMDLILLDTRLEGRNQQINDATDPALQDPDRTLLGSEQKNWLLDQLDQSAAHWKVIAQQVIFAELNVGWAALVDPSIDYFGYESIFMDIWDGYPAERAALIEHIDTSQIDNVVILTGDFHSTFAYDVPAMPVDLEFQEIPGFGTLPFYNPTNYDPVTGENSVLVEFATPSVSSANFDENTDLTTAQLFQDQINTNIEAVPGVLDLGNPNPHMKMTELIRHGYYILDVKPDSVQANWYFSAIDTVTNDELFHNAWYTRDGENHLNQGQESEAKDEQDLPAPADPPAPSRVYAPRDFSVLGVYPNPCVAESFLHYSLSKGQSVQVRLFDEGGRLIQVLVDETLPAGTYTLRTHTEKLRPGLYFYEVRVGEAVETVKLVRAN